MALPAYTAHADKIVALVADATGLEGADLVNAICFAGLLHAMELLVRPETDLARMASHAADVRPAFREA